MFCKKCGNQLNDSANFCTKCGTPVEKAPVNKVAPPTLLGPTKPGYMKKTIDVPEIPKRAPENKAVKQPKVKQQRVKQPKSATQKAIQNKRILLISASIGIVLVIAAIIAAIIYTINNGSLFGSSSKGIEKIKKEKNSEKEQVVDAHELLLNKYNELKEEKGYSAGQMLDMVSNKGEVKFENVGVIGGLIQDISGDEVEDLVAVYADAKFETVYADVYTIEENEVIEKEKEIILSTNEAWDIAKASVYLKKTEDGYNLICDNYSLVCHFADGVENKLTAYKCKDHEYDMVVNYSCAGSDLGQTEIDDAIANAQKAGLSNITTAFRNMFVAQDEDVIFIAGYTTTVSENFDFTAFYENDNCKYGKLKINELTPNATVSDEQVIAFRNEVGTVETVQVATEENSDYILPQSNQRLLTDEDIKGIVDDEKLLKLAINEIYARYGRKFNTEWMQQYFDSKPWYKAQYDPQYFDDNITVTEIETQNATYLRDIYNSKYVQ